MARPLHHPPEYELNEVFYEENCDGEMVDISRGLPSTCSMCGAAVEDERQHTAWHEMLMPLLLGVQA